MKRAQKHMEMLAPGRETKCLCLFLGKDIFYARYLTIHSSRYNIKPEGREKGECTV